MGGGMPPQMPPGGPQGGSGALSQLAKKPSTPESGAPLLQMIMSMLAGAGLKDATGSLTSLMKVLSPGGGAHHKASGAPPGQQPSKPGMPPVGPQAPQGAPPGAPPMVSGAQGGPKPPGGPAAGGPDPGMLMKLLAMLMGGQGQGGQAGEGGPPQQ